MRKVLGVSIWVAAIAALAFLVQAKDAELGSPAPDFALMSADGATYSLSKYRGKYVVLEWTNPECPFVKKHYNSKNMQTLQKTWKGKDVVWLSIDSSAKGKQGYYEPKEWKKILSEKGAEPTALLIDADGKVGKQYAAKTTPSMYVINPQGLLIYKGAIDDKRSADVEDVKGAKNFVSLALEESMAGKPVRYNSTQSYGCSVKY
jgi:peroxiredoxin